MSAPVQDFSEIPDSGVVPYDMYDFTFTHFELGATRAGSKMMITAHSKIVAPPMYAGIEKLDYFTLGTDEDPSASNPLTQKKSPGYRNAKQFLAAVYRGVDNLPKGYAMEDLFPGVQGYPFTALLDEDEDTNPTTTLPTGQVVPNQYFGTKRNRFLRYYPPGQQQAGSQAGKKPAMAVRPGLPSGVPLAAPPPAAGPPAVAVPPGYASPAAAAPPSAQPPQPWNPAQQPMAPPSAPAAMPPPPVYTPPPSVAPIYTPPPAPGYAATPGAPPTMGAPGGYAPPPAAPPPAPGYAPPSAAPPTGFPPPPPR